MQSNNSIRFFSVQAIAICLLAGCGGGNASISGVVEGARPPLMASLLATSDPAVDVPAPIVNPDNPVRPDFTTPAVPEGYTYYHDVFIGTGGQSNIYMDIVAPATDPGRRLPVLARIHGGGWNHGDKDTMANAIASDASKGYVGVAMMYRLTPAGYVFPAQLHDLKLGVRYLRANAEKYFIDQNKIGAAGSSAGGHLASLLGTTGGIAALEGSGGWNGYSSRVQAVTDASGPADFTTNFANGWSSVTALLGGAAQSIPQLAHAAMPGDYATADDPPFLILHGDSDSTVPYTDSIYLKNQLIAAGVDTTFSLVAGAPHSLSAYSWTSDIQRAFMDYHLKGVGSKPIPPVYVPIPGPVKPPSAPDPLTPTAAWQLDEPNSATLLTDTSQSDPGVALKRNGVSGQSSAVGKIGNAVHFVDGYSYLSNSAPNYDTAVTALNFAQSNKFTIETWVNLDSLPSDYTAAGSAKLISKVNSTTKAGYELFINGADNKPTFKIWVDGTTRYAATASAPINAVGQWLHLAGTYDGTALRIYVNGVLSGTTPWTGTLGNSGNTDIKIGAASATTASASSGIKGWMDEVRLYDRTLNDVEIMSRFKPLAPVAKWSLDEADSATALADTAQSFAGVTLKRNGAAGQISAAGRSGNAVHFVDGYSYLTNTAPGSDASVTALNFTQSNRLAVETWVKLDSLPSSYTPSGSAKLVSKINATSKSGYELFINGADNKPVFKVWLDATNRYAAIANAALTVTDQWVHLVGSYDGTALRIYVNGTLSGTTPWSGTIGNSGDTDIKVGGNTTATLNASSGLKGWMDEVRLYDRAPTAAEVASRFAAP